MGLIETFLHKLASPRWGVHPDDHKRPAADAPLRALPLPARLYVPLLQHVGQAARPTVLVGQKVLQGQLIGEAQGRISAPIHAPTLGGDGVKGKQGIGVIGNERDSAYARGGLGGQCAQQTRLSGTVGSAKGDDLTRRE